MIHFSMFIDCWIATQMNISISKGQQMLQILLANLIQNCNGLPEIRTATAITFVMRGL